MAENQWAPWSSDPVWRDGDRVMPPWVPEYRTISSDQWVKFRAPAGMGWLPDGVTPYGNDATPIPPWKRPRGPGTAISMQAGERWLREHNQWPEPGSAYAQLAELRAKQAQGRRRMIGIGGPLAQHTAIGRYEPPSHPMPPSFQD
jgi:hypothetical protein